MNTTLATRDSNYFQNGGHQLGVINEITYEVISISHKKRIDVDLFVAVKHKQDDKYVVIYTSGP